MAYENSEIVKEFLIESFESLLKINDEITYYEKNPTDKDLLNSIFRKVHTLKGSSGFLGLKKLQEITHSAESILDLIRNDSITLSTEKVDIFLECFDSCLELLKSIEETGKENNKDYSSLKRKFSIVLEKEISSSDNLYNDGGINIEELPDKKAKSNNSTKSEAPPAKIPELKKVEIPAVKEKSASSLIPIVKEIEPEHSSEQSANKTGGLADSVVRVNVQLLDKIMNIVGELVLNRNQILQFASTIDSSELNRLSQQLNIITTELQTDIMTTRMQPVGNVLSKFERIVRDLSRSQGKKIKFEIIGKDTELDKTLLEAIRDPLTHLVRNSVDHGVELPEIRLKNNKPEEGIIIIKSFHEGGQVTIEINDDGNGIDPKKILDKAIQKGIINLEQSLKMSPRQILNIIFMPGFSTAEQVTNISGRGVGMDVVKSNIEKIGGTVDIISEVGEGTTFKLKIPLTLAIVPALVIQNKGETFAIPQVNLLELVRLEGKESLAQLEVLHDSEFFRLRGNLIPIFRLSESLNDPRKMGSGTLVNELEKNESLNIVILSADDRVYGLIVDSILDTEEIVVKPLSKKLKNLTLFAGATIMGDGRVALIVDALGFFNTVDRGNEHKLDTLMNHAKQSNNYDSENQEVLICSLNDKRNYAIPLMLVNRLEEFQASDVEWTGDQAIMKYGNSPMPLINLEKTLKIKEKSLIDEVRSGSSEIVPCVVVKIRENSVGLVVNKIKDIAVSEGDINSDIVDRQGLLGTIFTDGKTVSILDVHEIVEMQKIGLKSGVQIVKKCEGRILIVEDSPLYRKVLKDFLEESGYEVALANNGKDGLGHLAKGDKFDLVISDIEMPIMDGWEFAKKVRLSKNEYSNIPIIALSSKLTPQDREKGLAVGFTGHLEKLNKVEVLETVNKLRNISG